MLPARSTLLLVLLACFIAAKPQSTDALLGQLGTLERGPERLDLLVRAARQESALEHWEDAADLARLGMEEGQQLDAPAQVAECARALSHCSAAQGHSSAALSEALRALSFSDQAGPNDEAASCLWLAQLFDDMDAYQRALEYAQQAAASIDLKGPDRIAYLRIMGGSYTALGEVDNALIAYNELRAIPGVDDETMFTCLRSIVALETQAGDYAKGIEACTDLVALLVPTGRTSDLGVAFNNLGELHLKQANYREALSNFTDATTWLYAEPTLYEQVLINIAVLHAQQGQLAQALTVAQNAVRSAEKRQCAINTVRCRNLRAGLLILDGRYSEAREDAVEAQRIARDRHLLEEEVEACDLLARIARQRNFFQEAGERATRAEELRRAIEQQRSRKEDDRNKRENELRKLERDQIDMFSTEQRNRLELQQTLLDAENQGKEMEILQYEKELQEASIRQEALAREKAQQALALTEAMLDAERRERTIDKLQGEQTMQMLQVTKLELERKQKEAAMALLKNQNQRLEADRALKEASQRRDRLISRVAAGAVVVLIGLCLAAFWILRKLRGKNRIIRTQVKQIANVNDELSQKNADMLSSIQYARNIQGSIVPDIDGLRQELPDSFVFYKPRDVVSGDLPFVHRVGERLYIAAIDCTGHGVPAAMLSFIAYYNLHEILAVDADKGPAEVLQQLHIRVLNTIGRGAEGSTMSDGMDIGLCCLDLSAGCVTFAGAQTSMMVEREGQVERIKGDVRAIGDRFGYGPANFRDHTVELAPNDRVYLFSDGIIHQFGGDDGRRKFSYKRLAVELAALSTSNATSAYERIDRTFTDWKGNTEQTDDVLLIGFSLRETQKRKAA